MRTAAGPDGDSRSLRNVLITLAPQYGGDDFEVAGTRGLLNSQTTVNALPLIPGGDGGCLIHQPCPQPFKLGY